MLSAEVHALGQPDDAAKSHLEAWRMDDSPEDPRAPHRRRPDEPVTASALASLGVLSWHLPLGSASSAARLAAIRELRGYSYEDEVRVERATLQDYDAKLASFYEEHIHADEEVRRVLKGSGYFDVRRESDGAWVRIAVREGDLILLPAGLYHRFTLDEQECIVAQRLFVGQPVWTPINRGEEAEAHPARRAYAAQQATGEVKRGLAR